MFGLPVEVRLCLQLLTSVALHSAHKVVVLASGANPASIREVEVYRLLLA